METNHTSEADPGREFSAAQRQALRNRDPAALEAFFDAFFEPVHRYVVRAVGRDRAEDVTQEAFAHMYASLTMYDPTRSPRPWAFAIAINQVRAFWRRRGRGPVSVELPCADEPATPAGADPAAALVRSEARDEVRTALAGLPADLREVVHLRIHAGLSHEEIAEAVGASPVAVRKRYSRALALLRDMLGTLESPSGAEGSA